MFTNRFLKKTLHPRVEDIDQVKLIYALSLLVGLLSALAEAKPPSYIDKRENIETVMDTFLKTEAWNLPILDDGYYAGFISKSRIYTTYRELLIQFSEE